MSNELDTRYFLEGISAQTYRSLVEAIADFGIYILDPEGRVASWNRGAERFKGYTLEEVLGKYFGMFYTPEDREIGLPERALASARIEGRFENQGWRLRKDGSRFWAHAVIDRITDSDGVILGYAKITRDVTPQREASKQLERAREALFQSQKLESIGKLTGGVAHDFNNLLMVIHSSLEMIELKSADPTQVLRLVGHAKAAVQRGASLTQRMLAFARKQELRMQAMDLRTLVNDMMELLQRSLGPRIHFKTSFPDALDNITADANQLELALMNLALNARDAMPNGGCLTISAFGLNVDADHPTQLPSGRYVCVEIADDGIGMDEETVMRATEPFFTTKGVGKGTGLGLSMVHGLIEQSGGRMLIKSDKGMGTRVELWLPAAGADHTTSLPSTAHDKATLSLANNSLHVMVVDDDPLVRATTSVVLETLGHRAMEIASGEEALAALSAGLPIDLLLTDHAMPGMTGSELANAVSERWPDVPIVLASGYAEIDDHLCDGVMRLNKPYGRDDLIRTLNEVLSKKGKDHFGSVSTR
jgi:PAS domain S-box-containing protein